MDQILNLYCNFNSGKYFQFGNIFLRDETLRTTFRNKECLINACSYHIKLKITYVGELDKSYFEGDEGEGMVRKDTPASKKKKFLQSARGRSKHEI